MIKGDIKIYVTEDSVGIRIGDGEFCTVTPKVAVELAASLTLAAMEVDTEMDPEMITADYIQSRKHEVH